MKATSLILVLGTMLLGGTARLTFFDRFSSPQVGWVGEDGASVAMYGEGRITGKVTVTKAGSGASRPAKGMYGKSTSRLSKSTSTSKRAIVYVLKVPGKFPVPQSRPAMRQKNISIVPHVLPVLVGTTVDFPNEDDIYHNIFSLSSIKSFDLGRYAKGVSKSVTFTKEGEVRIFCDIHSQMSAYVWVLQNPYFATCSADGNYSIQGVPDGSYDIVAWHESGGKQTRKVKVDGGKEVSMDFTL